MAWYQRSYFNILLGGFIKYYFWKLIYILLMTYFVYNIITLNLPVKNSNIINIAEHTLHEFSYKGIIFNCSKIIPKEEAFIAIDNLLINYHNYNDYKFVKYYYNKNGILLPFPYKSCYSHLNLFIGCFQNTFYNYQFMHNNIENNFYFFTKNDINGFSRIQFALNSLNLYHNSLSKIYLNSNDVCLNNSYKLLNKKLVEKEKIYKKKVQNCIFLNWNNLTGIVKKSLKI